MAEPNADHEEDINIDNSESMGPHMPFGEEDTHGFDVLVDAFLG